MTDGGEIHVVEPDEAQRDQSNVPPDPRSCTVGARSAARTARRNALERLQSDWAEAQRRRLLVVVVGLEVQQDFLEPAEVMGELAVGVRDGRETPLQPGTAARTLDFPLVLAHPPISSPPTQPL